MDFSFLLLLLLSLSFFHFHFFLHHITCLLWLKDHLQSHLLQSSHHLVLWPMVTIVFLSLLSTHPTTEPNPSLALWQEEFSELRSQARTQPPAAFATHLGSPNLGPCLRTDSQSFSCAWSPGLLTCVELDFLCLFSGLCSLESLPQPCNR